MTSEDLASALFDSPAAGPCPAADRIWAAAAGEIPAQPLLDHALSCGDCALAWRLAKELQGETAQVVALRPRPLRRWAVSVAATMAVAAAALLSVRPPPAEYRSAASTGVRSRTSTELPRDRFVLRWESPDRNARWSVTLATLDLRTLHRASGLASTEYQVPAAALEIAPGTQLVWRVTGALPGGATVESPAFLVRLR